MADGDTRARVARSRCVHPRRRRSARSESPSRTESICREWNARLHRESPRDLPCQMGSMERAARRLLEWNGTRATKLDSGPFAGGAAEGLYDPLFADDPDRFAPAGVRLDPALGERSDRVSIRALADDSSAESRTRILAYRRLDALDPAERQERPPFLGVVGEIGLDEGLDVLAAYVDGSVRYLNHSGSTFISDDSPAIRPEVTALLARRTRRSCDRALGRG
jgi:hypothetical protein